MIRPSAVLAAFLICQPLHAQVRAGGEFRVNTFTPGYQYGSAAGVDRNGNFVVVWTTRDANSDVAAQRYDAAGTRIGTEFLISTAAAHQTARRTSTPIAMRPDGRFVVVWRNTTLQFSESVRGRRFEADGTPAGAEFEIAGPASYLGNANVAITPHGTFVVVWWRMESSPANDGDVWGQVFDAGANRVGPPFRVNADTTGLQIQPRVAADGDGNFVVVWTDRSHRDGSGDGVFGQMFLANGARLGGEFQVNTYTTDSQIGTSVSRAADGRFVIAYESYEEPAGITPSARVRRY